jgi:Flp pilus assembly protein TadG
MMRRIKRFLVGQRGSNFAETALTLPVMVLLTIALINMTIAGFASVNAANAANFGARSGSVAQQGSGGVAYNAALQSLSNAPVGDYTVNVSGGGFPGATITVTVEWEVPNYFNGLLSFFGGGPVDLKGTSTATFRQEGW